VQDDNALVPALWARGLYFQGDGTPPPVALADGGFDTHLRVRDACIGSADRGRFFSLFTQGEGMRDCTAGVHKERGRLNRQVAHQMGDDRQRKLAITMTHENAPAVLPGRLCYRADLDGDTHYFTWSDLRSVQGRLEATAPWFDLGDVDRLATAIA
jgi:hypothetical protein